MCKPKKVGVKVPWDIIKNYFILYPCGPAQNSLTYKEKLSRELQKYLFYLMP